MQQNNSISWELGGLLPLATNESNGLMAARDKCSIPFPLLSGGSYYVHVPMDGLPFLVQISAPSVAPGLFCCCKTSSSFTINRLFKSADIEAGLVFTYKESMLYVKRLGVYFNIIPLHSGYIFKQGTGDIPNDAIELTIQWIVDNMLLGELIGINDTWIRRRFAIKDCNTAIAGAYNVDDSTTNNFPTGAYKFGTLLVANSGFFGSQYFVPDNFNVDPYIYIRSISNNGNSFNKWAKIKVTIIT